MEVLTPSLQRVYCAYRPTPLPFPTQKRLRLSACQERMEMEILSKPGIKLQQVHARSGYACGQAYQRTKEDAAAMNRRTNTRTYTVTEQ